MSDSVVDAIQRTIAEQINELNTMLPGEIVSYNPATNRAVVRASLARRLADGTELAAPQIVSVPVKWPAGGGGRLTFPLGPGDPVELRFAQRSLDNWLAENPLASTDARSFDLNDCVCDPGLAASGIQGSQEGITLALGSAKIVIKTDGTIELSNGAGSVILGLNGKLTASVDVLAGTVSLATHRHINVQAGGGISGVPQT